MMIDSSSSLQIILRPPQTMLSSAWPVQKRPSQGEDKLYGVPRHGLTPLSSTPYASTMSISEDAVSPDRARPASRLRLDTGRARTRHVSSLPRPVQDVLMRRGITELRDWQAELLGIMLDDGESVLATCPTAAGKTLVAELLAFHVCAGGNTVISRKRSKVLIALPFTALVREMENSIRQLGEACNFRVSGYYAGVGMFPVPTGPHCIISTYEKASAVLQHLIEDDRADEVSLLVVDELHSVGLDERGCVVELLVTKFREFFPSARILGLSATLSEPEGIARWLGAVHYSSALRPHELVERFVVVDPPGSERDIKPQRGYWDVVRDANGDFVKTMPSCANWRNLPSLDGCERSIDAAIALASQVSSTLIFCATRKLTCEYATLTANSFRSRGVAVSEELRDLCLRLNESCGGFIQEGSVEADLQFAVLYGVGFHHAGLRQEQRSLIETAARDGILRIICCTPTLAAGVNLPAHRVVVIGPCLGSAVLSAAQYRQMCGRAGRGAMGESFLVATPSQIKPCEQVIAGPIPPCRSHLDPTNTSLMGRVVLDPIHLGAKSLMPYLRRTLFATQEGGEESMVAGARAALEMLLADGFIRMERYAADLLDADLVATPLGQATARSQLAISEAKEFHDNVVAAGQHFNLLSNLHMAYVLSFFNTNGITFNFHPLHDVVNDEHISVMERVGLSMGYVRGRLDGNDPKGEDEAIARRMVCALILVEIMGGKTVGNVSCQFGVPSGHVEMIMNNASSMGATLVLFCRAMNWVALEGAAKMFCDYFHIGMTPEAKNLFELPNMTRSRARLLHSHGYSIESLADADPVLLGKRLSLSRNSGRSANALVKHARELLRRKAAALAQLVGDAEGDSTSTSSSSGDGMSVVTTM